MARILIVEDEALIALSLAFTLETAGHEVRVAADGAKALRALERFRPDLLITDYMMPRMDGVELIRAVRARPELDGLRVLLMTAVAEERVGADGLAYDAFVRKPFSDEQVLELVTELVAAEGRNPG